MITASIWGQQYYITQHSFPAVKILTNRSPEKEIYRSVNRWDNSYKSLKELFLTYRRGNASVGLEVNRIIRYSMEIKWPAKYIDPQNLIEVSRGDERRLLKYLNRFQELIPQRIKKLQQGLKAEDRNSIRQTVHQMSPQLQFFGVLNIGVTLRRLEFEYETLPLEELRFLVDDFLGKLDGVQEEVSMILKLNFQ